MLIGETQRLRIRNWKNQDLDLMHLINSDDQVMEFFPSRRNREQSAELLQRIQREIHKTGYGFFAIELKETSEPIGFAGLAKPRIAPILPDGTVEIGWRLAPPHWGKGYVTEAARELLRIGFEERSLTEIVSFAVSANLRSLAVMRRVGMAPDPTRDFDHPHIPESHPHLKRHTIYVITDRDWRNGQRTTADQKP